MPSDMGFRLVSAQTMPITPEIVSRFRELSTSAAERPENKKRIEYLTDRINAGLATTFHWAEATVKGSAGPVYRMNGQHSSSVLASLNGTMPAGLMVHLDRYEVDSELALATLFRQFDPAESARSAADTAGVYQDFHPELAPIPRPIGKLICDGISWHTRQIEGVRIVRGNDRYLLFNETAYHPTFLWMAGILTQNELKNEGVIAAMHATNLVNPEAADAFWQEVRDGSASNDDSPSFVLDRWLRDVKLGNIKPKPPTGEIYQGCLYAWNAHRREQTIKNIRHDTSKAMLVPIE